ncbi:energy-coupling factor transporter transmembrane protein EcfT [Sporosarcina sp. Te-1]|uniref:energy-coupling factor transporter transmembrane component T family protein n=1 Tax=Sporosarcina sp. Te-1 TaxID=2818390 RepID=UPI001A9D0667|nr:energy-coupling factor transporter transmembrane component T [Sporosarcina sp. Te-1]QTD41121.1 energy-coupling factor transporter transmembrane protein EcfT [Sporosarcina sp. Te-1]
MRNMTLYVHPEKGSPVHRMDPVTKLFYVFTSVIISYMVMTHLMVSLVLAVSIFLLVTGKVFRSILPIIGVSFVLLASILIVQGFFHPDRVTVLWEIGPVTLYKEGFSIAFLILLRVLNMVCAFGVLILTTKPDELVETLIQRGLSPRFGYVLLSVLQIIPQMMALTGKIMDSQRARGLEMEGSLWVRLKSFIPLLGPVVLRSLAETRERSIALEVRGFNSTRKRTRLHEIQPYKYGIALKALLAAVLLSVIVWRIWS